MDGFLRCGVRMMTPKSLARSAGFDIVRYPSRVHSPVGCFLKTHHVETVLDVGANVGQYGHQLRTLEGFTGRIVSFEPDPHSFRLLSHRIRNDPKWTAREMALGEGESTAALHRSKLSVFNSFHDASAYGLAADETMRTVDTACVSVKPLDEIMEPPSDRTFLKVDTQGYEAPVLRGSRQYLTGNVVGLQLELSLRALYEGEPLWTEVIALAQDLGFVPWAFIPGFCDPVSGALAEMDGIFIRR